MPTPTYATVPVKGLVEERVKTPNPWVSITFDEPLGDNTPTILSDFAATAQMKGTFFQVGAQIAADEALAYSILQAGHEIANHSYQHVDLTQAPEHGFYQWYACNQIIKAACGFTPCLARPPLGRVDDSVVNMAAKLGLTTAKWTRTHDLGITDPAQIASIILTGYNGKNPVQRGDIILLHQIDSCTAALPAILAGLQARALRSVRLTELLGGSFH